MSCITDIDNKYVANTYKRFPVELISGVGSELYDREGKRYIDMGSGIGVTAFGIADGEWKDAVTSQLELLQHTSNLYYTSPCAELAKLLCQRTGLKKVFFGNSGAEANECAIKVARKYASDKKGSDYFNIITLNNSFHGRTLTTLAATGQAHYHELFQPLTAGFLYADANDIDSVKALIRANKTAAVMIECIQGEGGVIPLTREFATELRRLTEEEDILLIVDEVQTGNGRTGELYSYMNYGILPDIVTTAKGLGGGLPIGAAILGEKVEDTLGYGDHGSTFGGNPVCCAGALSILRRIDEKLLADVKRKSNYISSQLSSCKGITEVSGMGLMVGVKTVKPVSQVISRCIEKGVLCLSAKDKLRLLPALNIPDSILAEAIEIIKAVCESE